MPVLAPSEWQLVWTRTGWPRWTQLVPLGVILVGVVAAQVLAAGT